MSATRTTDRQAARKTTQAIATIVADANRLRRGVEGAKVWDITETIPGTFRVVTKTGDYAVWYFEGIDRWACSCPDFERRRRACKHILGLISRNDLVRPDTEIPLSLQGQAEWDDDTLPLEHISHEEDTRMEQQNRFTQDVAATLAAPFDLMAHSFKPGATTQDKTRALALTYVDPRLYQTRLDQVDPAWQSRYEVIALADRILVNCKLTVLSVTREDVGEALLSTEQRGKSVPDENAYTSAVAQAFKRACAQFGLGRYLYDAPKTWAEYDEQRRGFTVDGLAKLRKELARYIGDNGSKPQTQRPKPPAQPTRSDPRPDQVKVAYIQGLLTDMGYTTDEAREHALSKAGFPPFEQMSDEQAGQLIARLEARLNAKTPLGANGK
jgi:hypothetical protein